MHEHCRCHCPTAFGDLWIWLFGSAFRSTTSMHYELGCRLECTWDWWLWWLSLISAVHWLSWPWHWWQRALWYTWRRPCRTSPTGAPWMACSLHPANILVFTLYTSWARWCYFGCTFTVVLSRNNTDIENLRLFWARCWSTRCPSTLWRTTSLEGLCWWCMECLCATSWMQGHHFATSTRRPRDPFAAYCHSHGRRWRYPDSLGDCNRFTTINQNSSWMQCSSDWLCHGQQARTAHLLRHGLSLLATWSPPLWLRDPTDGKWPVLENFHSVPNRSSTPPTENGIPTLWEIFCLENLAGTKWRPCQNSPRQRRRGTCSTSAQPWTSHIPWWGWVDPTWIWLGTIWGSSHWFDSTWSMWGGCRLEKSPHHDPQFGSRWKCASGALATSWPSGKKGLHG